MEVLEGIGFLPRDPNPNTRQVYTIADTDLCLIATAEITLGGMHKDQIFDEAELPKRYVGLSHCFRTEAGAAGRDTRGLYRVHQFTKVEMFAFCTPEQSEAMHREILGIEEEVFQGLGLAYHVIDTCTGDLGGPAYRKYDLEAWMPGRGSGGEYGEVTSTSNCTDYQARRLGIRYKSAGAEGDEVRVHAQRHRHRVHAGDRGDPGELPAGRRLGADSGRAAALVGEGRDRGEEEGVNHHVSVRPSAAVPARPSERVSDEDRPTRVDELQEVRGANL